MIGSLKQFNISTLLRILGKGEKTGKLLIKFENDVYEIWLQQGRIVAILSSQVPNFQQLLPKYSEHDPALNMMINKLSDICCNLNESLGNCLKRQGMVGPSVLAHIFRQQLHEGLYSIASDENGQFSFENTTALPYAEMTGLSKDASEASLDILRSPASYLQLQSELPSAESRFSKFKDGFFLQLSPVEWSVIEKINPQRTINDLALTSGLETLEVQQICFRLLAMELIKVSKVADKTVADKTDPVSLPKTLSPSISPIIPNNSVTQPTPAAKIEDKNLPSFSLLSRLTTVLRGIRAKVG